MTQIPIDLTDHEWVLLMDGQGADSALPICCANVSALRDVIELILRGGREMNDIYAAMLLERYEVFSRGHDFHSDPLDRLIAQAKACLLESGSTSHPVTQVQP